MMKTIETGRISRLKIAGALAVTLLAAPASNVIKPVNGDSMYNSKSQPSEHLIGPVPCTEPMPWEPNYNGSDQEAGKSVTLASIKHPEPTPDRNQPECWIIVKDQTSGTIFEN